MWIRISSSVVAIIGSIVWTYIVWALSAEPRDVSGWDRSWELYVYIAPMLFFLILLLASLIRVSLRRMVEMAVITNIWILPMYHVQVVSLPISLIFYIAHIAWCGLLIQCVSRKGGNQ